MITFQEEQLLKLVDRKTMRHFEDYLSLKIQNKINKLIQADPSTIEFHKGEIKGLQSARSDCGHLIRGTKTPNK